VSFYHSYTPPWRRKAKLNNPISYERATDATDDYHLAVKSSGSMSRECSACVPHAREWVADLPFTYSRCR